MVKILMLDVHNENYDHVASISEQGKKDYCQQHGYDFISHSFDFLPDRGPTWGRVVALKKYLPEYDWILYLDTDTIITNTSILIEDQIDERFDVMIGRMPDYATGKPTHISTSAILLKQSDWSFKFLDLWYEQKQFADTPYIATQDKDHLSTRGTGGLFYEQSAFHYLYDHSEDVRKHTKLMPDRWFNCRESYFLPSSFLVHFARPKNKAERMKEFLRQWKLIM